MEQNPSSVSADWQTIKLLGGPTKVAKMLGWVQPGAAQRIQNWKTRGIPPAVKLAFPHLFLLPLNGAAVPPVEVSA